MPSGVLLLDKPLGLSSNAALQRVRALFAREKAGHVGSLDPLATGMLPVCLGEATKIAGDILSGAKCYRFTATLGTATRTGDTEGEITRTAPVPELAPGALAPVLARFVGTSTQVPPMYSALKQRGQPLYRLARAGIEVPRAARPIQIRRLQAVGFDGTHLELEVLCSKGTYVRVLAEDIAAALGTCAHVTALRRLWVEPFEGGAMYTLESLQDACAGGASPALIPLDQPLGHLPAAHLGALDAERVRKGQRVFTASVTAAARVRLYDPDGNFLGLGEDDGAGSLEPRRLLRTAPT